MQTKVTLELDETVVRKAEEYARRQGKSLSEVVSKFLETVAERPSPPQVDLEKLSPRLRSLVGILNSSSVSKKDYYDYLEKKYL